MASWYRHAGALGLLIVLSIALIAEAQQPADPTGAPQQAQPRQPRPVPKGRVFVWDLEGTWLSQAYLQQLQSTRSPRVAGTRAPALAIKVQREERSYPIVITDFHKASSQFLIEIEPAGKPGAYRMVVAPEDGAVSSSDATYIAFQGEKNEQGKFDHLSIAEPFFNISVIAPIARNVADALLAFEAMAGPDARDDHPRGVHDHFPDWRNYKEYGGGGVTDWGAHHFDIAQWALGMDASGPIEVIPPEDKSAKYGVKFIYLNGVPMFHTNGNGVTFLGEKGKLYVNRGIGTVGLPFRFDCSPELTVHTLQPV